MKRLFVFVGLLMLAAGCATFDVNYDFDPEADFTRIKTYDWSPMPEKTQINELTLKHLKLAVNRDLQAKGFTMAQENPDILIAMRAAKEKRVDVQEWGYGYDDRDYYPGTYFPRQWHPVPGAGDRDYFEYRRGSDTYEYEVGTLMLDVVDAKKKELIWRGMASGVIDPGKTAEQIQEIVGKLLENFPPGKKK
jgi:hypothetical protein